jgi:hypothetical protein
MLQIVVSLTDNSGGITYDRNIFIIQATGLFPVGCVMWHTSSGCDKLDYILLNPWNNETDLSVKLKTMSKMGYQLNIKTFLF